MRLETVRTGCSQGPMQPMKGFFSCQKHVFCLSHLHVIFVLFLKVFVSKTRVPPKVLPDAVEPDCRAYSFGSEKLENRPWSRNLVVENIFHHMLHNNIVHLKYFIFRKLEKTVNHKNYYVIKQFKSNYYVIEKYNSTFEIVTNTIFLCINWWCVWKLSVWIQTRLCQNGTDSKGVYKSLKPNGYCVGCSNMRGLVVYNLTHHYLSFKKCDFSDFIIAIYTKREEDWSTS